MEKIKKLEETILSPDTILGELLKPKRYIISPDGSKDEDSYILVINVGNSVKDISIGDIIIKVGGQMTGYPFKDTKGVERKIVCVSRGAVLVAVKPDNFIDPDKITAKVNV